jgi:hypothetical protein
MPKDITANTYKIKKIKKIKNFSESFKKNETLKLTNPKFKEILQSKLTE